MGNLTIQDRLIYTYKIDEDDRWIFFPKSKEEKNSELKCHEEAKTQEVVAGTWAIDVLIKFAA